MSRNPTHPAVTRHRRRFALQSYNIVASFANVDLLKMIWELWELWELWENPSTHGERVEGRNIVSRHLCASDEWELWELWENPSTHGERVEGVMGGCREIVDVARHVPT